MFNEDFIMSYTNNRINSIQCIIYINECMCQGHHIKTKTTNINWLLGVIPTCFTLYTHELGLLWG